MKFNKVLRNRLHMPTKHVLVCEDTLDAQLAIAEKFSRLFPYQGFVQVSYVCGGNQARAIVEQTDVDLILLDCDMPDGNGVDFIEWLRAHGYATPVITFSGIMSNNCHLQSLGADILAD